ncbi:MAG: elongation factor P hydroxylase [Planctomycetes bacterium]|nr:elongation factor P hydroxylase [Planctomycetota bacterium]
MTLEVLLQTLNTEFLNNYQTQLLGGFAEPFYKAHQGKKWAEIQFREDFFRSALHELAHWCVAGKERRGKDDFGYWYVPDGRNDEDQELFYKVEVKPQAIEWAFSVICDVPFDLSLDNLAGQPKGVAPFRRNVKIQVQQYLEEGFPERTAKILALLATRGQPLESLQATHLDF